jgi:hypothetical protein
MLRRINRRDALKLTFAGGVAAMLQACGSRSSHGDNSATVPRFDAALPIPPVLEPTRSDDHGDYYEIEARESTAARFCRGNRRRSEVTTASFLDRRLRPRGDEQLTSDLQPSSRPLSSPTFMAVTLPPTQTGGRRM